MYVTHTGKRIESKYYYAQIQQFQKMLYMGVKGYYSGIHIYVLKC